MDLLIIIMGGMAVDTVDTVVMEAMVATAPPRLLCIPRIVGIEDIRGRVDL